MSCHAAPSLRRSRYSSHTRRSVLPDEPCLRPGELPCAGRAPPTPSHHGKGDTGLRRCRVPVACGCEHIPAISSTWQTRKSDAKSDARPSPGESPPACLPNTSSGDRACGLTEGGFFHDSSGGPSPRRQFPVAAMSAPGIEHRRVSALVRGSMEHTNRYMKEIGTPKRVTRGTPTTGCARE